MVFLLFFLSSHIQSLPLTIIKRTLDKTRVPLFYFCSELLPFASLLASCKDCFDFLDCRYKVTPHMAATAKPKTRKYISSVHFWKKHKMMSDITNTTSTILSTIFIHCLLCFLLTYLPLLSFAFRSYSNCIISDNTCCKKKY